MCQGEGIGLDNIRELVLGRRSSRLVLVVSDLVSDLEELVVSAVELTGPSLRLGLIVLLKGASPNRTHTSVLWSWSFAAYIWSRLGPLPSVFPG